MSGWPKTHEITEAFDAGLKDGWPAPNCQDWYRRNPWLGYCYTKGALTRHELDQANPELRQWQRSGAG